MSIFAALDVPFVASPNYFSMQSDMGCNKLTVDVAGASPRQVITEANPGPNPMAKHKWEQAGLGVAPYKLIGSGTMTYQACHDAPIQPGGSCDYCGQGITNVYFIKAKCGSKFKVGCDCVRHTCSAKEGVLTEVEQAVRKHNKTVRDQRNAAKKDELSELIEQHRADFATRPHPKWSSPCDKAMTTPVYKADGSGVMVATWPAGQSACGVVGCAHHRSFFADKTLADYYDFMFKGCGAAGKSRLLKELKARIATLTT